MGLLICLNDKVIKFDLRPLLFFFFFNGDKRQEKEEMS